MAKCMEDKHRERVIKLAHDENGHPAQRRTSLGVQMNFWWPRVRRDVARYVKSCDFCQRKRRVTESTIERRL